MTLAERIKDQRKRRGLSQEKAADLVGVSRHAVTKWETGHIIIGIFLERKRGRKNV